MKKGFSAVLKFFIWIFLVLGVFVLGFVFRYELLNFFGITYIGENSQIKIDSVLISSDNQTAYVLIQSNDPRLNFSHFEIIFQGSEGEYSYFIENYSITSKGQEFNLTSKEIKSQNSGFKDFSKIEFMRIVFRPRFDSRTFSNYIYQYDYEKVSREKDKILNETFLEKEVTLSESFFINTEKKIRKSSSSEGRSSNNEDSFEEDTPEENDTKEIFHNLSRDSLAYFSFDETSGGVISDSENKFNGTLNNVSIVKGVSGKAINFNGTGYIDLGVNEEFGLIREGISLSLWIRPHDFGGDYQGLIMHGGLSEVDSYALYISPSKGEIGFKTSGTNNSWISYSHPSIYDGNWHHLVVTYDNSTKKIYLDGIIIYTVNASGNINSGIGKRLLFGAGRDFEEPLLKYYGLVDEVRIYNFSLNDSEIINLYLGFNFSEENNSIEEPTVVEEIEPFVCPSGSNCYYISSSMGSDSNNGTSEVSPWRSLEKVNSETFLPGDYVMFKRGDSWEGTLTIGSSGTEGNPITFGAYGTSLEKPRIYGSEVLTGWTLHKGNIWKAQVDKDVSQLFIDGERVRIARYPKEGYALISEVFNSTTFSSLSLDSDKDYIGAIWFGRHNQYSFEQQTVIDSKGQILRLDENPYWNLDVAEGFFLMNKLEFLTGPGEWYFDYQTKTIYLWTPKGDSPENYEVRGSIYEKGIEVLDDSRKYHLVIKDFNILHPSSYGIYMKNAHYIQVINNSISKVQKIGIYSNYAGRDILINGNNVSDAFYKGIHLSVNYGDCEISYNNVDTVGRLSSIGSGFISSSRFSPDGIASMNYKVNISYNKIKNTGYKGIYFNVGVNPSVGPAPALVYRNVIDGAMAELNDGGAIYTVAGATYNPETDSYDKPGSAGSIISENLILNTYGNELGSAWGGKPSNTKQAYGIYLDAGNHDIIVRDNVIVNSSYGLFRNWGGYNVFENNVIFDCLVGIISNGAEPKSNYTNNLVFTTNRTGWPVSLGSDSHQRVVFEMNGADDLYAKNTYFVPYEEESVFVNYGGFNDWQSSGKDSDGKYDGSDRLNGESERIIYNWDEEEKIFDLKGYSFKDIYGNQVEGSITLQPYDYEIIIGNEDHLNLI